MNILITGASGGIGSGSSASLIVSDRAIERRTSVMLCRKSISA